MRTVIELKEAIAKRKTLYWNDPDPSGNEFMEKINFIEDINPEFDEDDFSMYPILIQYNDFKSEAQVYLHEIIAL